MRQVRSAAPALLAAALLLASGAARVHAQAPSAGAAPPRVPARVTLTMDAGAASVRYDEYLRTSAVTLSPAGRLDLASGSISARGAFSRFAGGNRSWQGALAGAWLVPLPRRLTLELGASGSSTYYDGVPEGEAGADQAGSFLAEARLHSTGAGRGAWLGLSGGLASDGFDRRGLWQVEGTLWRNVRGATVVAAVRPTATDDFVFADAELAARLWWRARLELSATLGARGGDEISGTSTWQELGATWWMGPRAALVAGLGRYPLDVLNGVPGARYAALSFRIASRPPPRLEAALRPARAARPGSAPLALLRAMPAGDFSVRALADGRVLLRVRAPEAGTVELMGDFTDWEPLPLTRAPDGTWERAFALAPGTYRFNVRRDGGAWEVPTGVMGLPDDLGGEAGLLVVG